MGNGSKPHYVQVAINIADHPKTRKARRELDMTTEEFIGRYVLFLIEVQRFAPDGDLSDYSYEDIAEWWRWEGDTSHLIDTLVNCGPGEKKGFLEWADDDERGPRLLVHDWTDFTGALHLGNRPRGEDGRFLPKEPHGDHGGAHADNRRGAQRGNHADNRHGAHAGHQKERKKERGERSDPKGASLTPTGASDANTGGDAALPEGSAPVAPTSNDPYARGLHCLSVEELTPAEMCWCIQTFEIYVPEDYAEYLAPGVELDC